MITTRPRAWTEKPPYGSTIHWGNPITVGLIRAWTFTDQARLRAIDLVRGDILTHTRDQADVGQVVGPMGSEFQSGADGSAAWMLGSQTNNGIGATGCTIALGVRPHTTNGFLETTYTGVATVNANPRPRIYYTATNIHWNASETGVDVGADAAMTVTGGVNYAIVGSYIRDTAIATYAGTWNLLVNGRFFGPNNSAAGTFAGTFDSTHEWRLANDQGAPLASSHMFFSHIYIWNRGLLPTEMRQIQNYPWSIFNPSLLGQSAVRGNSTPTPARIIFRNVNYA